MSVAITSVTAVQGTGSYVKESAIEVTVVFTNTAPDNLCHIDVDLTVNAGVNWYVGSMHTSYSGLSVLQGTRVVLLLCRNTVDAHVGLTDYNGATAKVRAKVTDNVTSDTTAYTESSVLALNTFKPTIDDGPTAPDYVPSTFDVTVEATNNDSDAPSYYRLSTSTATLNTPPTVTPPVWPSAAILEDLPYTVSSGTESGFITLYLRVYDQFYNVSDVVSVGSLSLPGSVLPWVQREAPAVPTVNIVGTQGLKPYTGIDIQGDGSFVMDRTATLQLSAVSPIPVTYKILTESNIQSVYSVNAVNFNAVDETSHTLVALNSQPVVTLTTNRATPTVDNFDQDATVVVQVEFTDAAGNQATKSSSIRLNTRIMLTDESPMRTPDGGYQHTLREVTTGGNEIVIPQTMILTDEVERAWPDIFFPTTHSYPLTPEGEFDEAAALVMNGESDAVNDAVSIDDGAVVYDEEDRPVTVDWTQDGSKNYTNLLSTHLASIQHWVIDATDRGDFQLEFEYFDLDSRVFGPPFNALAPHNGDVLVIYDATAPGALTSVLDEFGNQTWELDDSTQLVEIAAYTGSGTGVINLTTGMRATSGPNGSFTTAMIQGIPKLVMILYTDASESGSGFKLKSSPAYPQEWINYHVDEANGEVWVHKHESLGTASGAADTTVKKMVYDYLDGYVYMDLELAQVSFDSLQTGTVLADWSYYTHSTPQSTTFLASQDDFVDYQNAPVYATLEGVPVADTDKSLVFENDDEGRIITGLTWDKDRGLLEAEDVAIFDGRRLFADHYHHTYKRLTDDGYGDLTFHDSVIVADETPAYPDYTWADIKIVNEGGAALEDGKVVFAARGHDTNQDGDVILDVSDSGGDAIVDQVLNINRPWDVQKGTKEETYTKMAMAYSSSFIWDRSCPKTGGNGQTGSSGAAPILSYWSNRIFGDLAARYRGYGRVVWVLGGTSGSSYPATSSGQKSCSLEVSGKFYNTTVI